MGCARIETNHHISDVNLFISRAIDVLKQDPGRRDQPVTKKFVCPCGCITARPAYLDSATNEIVLVFVTGNEIRIDVTSLIDVYDGVQSATASVSVDNHVICCDIRTSPDAGSIIGTNENGLYAHWWQIPTRIT